MSDRKVYSGSTTEEIAHAIRGYFPEDSAEFTTVVSDWENWAGWKAGKRRTKKAEDGSLIPQEQPEYRNSFSIKMDGEIGEIRFRKEIVFADQVKKKWDERMHGIMENIFGYHLII